MCFTRNQAYCQRYRGFESHPLRQTVYKLLIYMDIFYEAPRAMGLVPILVFLLPIYT